MTLVSQRHHFDGASRWCFPPSTTFLPACLEDALFSKNLRAGDGIRTRDPKLGKLVLYQLSYSRAGRGL